MTSTVYVPLLDEGIDVSRPAPAWPLSDGRYIFLRPADYDPDVETWRFPPRLHHHRRAAIHPHRPSPRRRAGRDRCPHAASGLSREYDCPTLTPPSRRVLSILCQ